MIRWAMTLTSILTMSTIGCQPGSAVFDEYVEEHGRALEKIRQLNEAHAAAVHAETMPDRARSMERQHRSEMEVVLSSMRGTMMDRMMECDPACCTERDRMMHGMEGALDDHASDMEAAVSLDQMHEAETRHQERMAGEMEMMEDDHAHMEDMMGMNMDMGCE